jgi:uracil-DNA glycosylase
VSSWRACLPEPAAIGTGTGTGTDSGPGARLSAPLSAQFERLSGDWRAIVDASDRAARSQLCDYIDRRIQRGVAVFPPRPFAALELLEPAAVRVVVLGQDPYHGPGQAHGLAFSVSPGVRPPPSLRNMFAELRRDLGCEGPADGDLRRWAAQGVLLLNSVLTVEHGVPGAHAGRGWEAVTDRILAALAAMPQSRVYMLWGLHAQRKRDLIDAGVRLHRRPHAVLTANHPSPLSARRGPQPFLGCGHFSRANDFLRQHGLAPIRW